MSQIEKPKLHLPYTIGDYILFEELGHGGFSTVYKCKNLRYDDIFAAKVMHITQDNKTQLETYQHEVHNLSRLNHQNVIRLYDAFAEDNILFVILEYCPKGTLADELSKSFPLTKKRLYYLVSHIASALDYCHSNNIVHRDLKLSNVLIDEYDRPKIADFGLSTEIKNGNMLNDFRCSVTYAAPEIFAKSAYDPFMADVWALGVLFYYLICGRSPWESRHFESLRDSITCGCYSIPEEADQDVATLIRRMIVNNPNDRITMKKIRENKLFKHTYFASIGSFQAQNRKRFEKTKPNSRVALNMCKTFRRSSITTLNCSSQRLFKCNCSTNYHCANEIKTFSENDKELREIISE
ncbi:CAMK family protein kinase [Tritrichomonas foetus]|uniref:CAMK family protein kinase n=1 Tax=Tritrichomonas foetus TaxID=1144522 RepID=A0A1J4JSS0_9EUKA|nr:CAMK family protein kinase [Tritrichomonas foetus]|eukprot:OHT00558.1 CAMK family protein kinase [Tritrichomonas foetus]